MGAYYNGTTWVHIITQAGLAVFCSSQRDWCAPRMSSYVSKLTCTNTHTHMYIYIYTFVCICTPHWVHIITQAGLAVFCSSQRDWCAPRMSCYDAGRTINLPVNLVQVCDVYVYKAHMIVCVSCWLTYVCVCMQACIYVHIYV